MVEIKIRQKVDTSDYRSNEAYKSLRTNIEFSGEENKIISFTSCTPNEGKSSVSMSLALSLAESGKRVLFIDADMRKGYTHKLFNVNNDNGLSDYLSGRVDTEKCIITTYCTVKIDGKTGVEMEALTGVSVTLLTIYDMCKAIDKKMELSEIHLVKKTGGKSGDFYYD